MQCANFGQFRLKKKRKTQAIYSRHVWQTYYLAVNRMTLKWSMFPNDPIAINQEHLQTRVLPLNGDYMVNLTQLGHLLWTVWIVRIQPLGITNELH